MKEYVAGVAPQESAEDAIVKAALDNAGEAAAGLVDLKDCSKPGQLLNCFLGNFTNSSKQERSRLQFVTAATN